MGASRSSRSATASAASSGAPSTLKELVVPLDPEQRSRLLAAKARVLVSDHLGVDPSTSGADLRASAFPGGGAVQVGASGWVVADQHPERSLGPALVWAHREGVDELNLVVDDPAVAAVLARRAAAFTRPPQVWSIDGRALRRAEPAPRPVPIEPAAAAREAAGLLHAAGVDVTVEHGLIRGEIRGLEVARVSVDDDGSARVEVGVGRHDREAFAMVHGDLPAADALASVVRSVDTQRRPEAEAQALSRLALEGWLRWRLIAEPAVIGLAELRSAESTQPRESVKDSGAAIGVGTDPDGATVVVACSVGIDLDLVPSAADARDTIDPEARLLIVVPERDDHPVTRRLALELSRPAQVVALAGDWRRPGSDAVAS